MKSRSRAAGSFNSGVLVYTGPSVLKVAPHGPPRFARSQRAADIERRGIFQFRGSRVHETLSDERPAQPTRPMALGDLSNRHPPCRRSFKSEALVYTGPPVLSDAPRELSMRTMRRTGRSNWQGRRAKSRSCTAGSFNSGVLVYTGPPVLKDAPHGTPRFARSQRAAAIERRGIFQFRGSRVHETLSDERPAQPTRPMALGDLSNRHPPCRRSFKSEALVYTGPPVLKDARGKPLSGARSAPQRSPSRRARHTLALSTTLDTPSRSPRRRSHNAAPRITRAASRATRSAPCAPVSTSSVAVSGRRAFERGAAV